MTTTTARRYLVIHGNCFTSHETLEEAKEVQARFGAKRIGYLRDDWTTEFVD